MNVLDMKWDEMSAWGKIGFFLALVLLSQVVAIVCGLLSGIVDWFRGGCVFITEENYTPPYHPPVSNEYKEAQKQAAIEFITLELTDARAGNLEAIRQRKRGRGTTEQEMPEQVAMILMLSEYPGTPREVATAWREFRDVDWYRAMNLTPHNPTSPNWLSQTLAIRAKQKKNG